MWRPPAGAQGSQIHQPWPERGHLPVDGADARRPIAHHDQHVRRIALAMKEGPRQRDQPLHHLLVALRQPLEGVSGTRLERLDHRALHPAAVRGRAVTQQMSGFRDCVSDRAAARMQVGQPACRGLP